MKFKKLASIVTLGIVCSNMLAFAAYADSNKNNSNLGKKSNDLLMEFDNSQNNRSFEKNVIDKEEYIEPSILSESIDNSDEKEQILNSLYNSKIDAREVLFSHDDVLTNSNFKGVKNKQDLSFGEPYKVVLFSNDIKDALNAGTTIEEAIDNSPYYWEVPIINSNNKKVVSTCIVDKLENQWQIVEVGSNLDGNNVDLSKDHKKISKLMRKMNIKDIKYFDHIRFSQLGYDVLYAETDKDEYFIPLVFEGNKDSKLKDKFSYSKENFVKTIQPLLDIQSSDEILLGGSTTQYSKSVIFKFIESIFGKFSEIFR